MGYEKGKTMTDNQEKTNMSEEIWADKNGKRFDGNFDSQGYFNGAACYLLKSTVDMKRAADRKTIQELAGKLDRIVEMFGPCQNDYIFSKRQAIQGAKNTLHKHAPRIAEAQEGG